MILRLFFLLALLASFSQKAFCADDEYVEEGPGRMRNCNINADGNVEMEGMYMFDPNNSGKSRDLVTDIDKHPACTAEIIANYLTFRGAIFGMNKACGTGSGFRLVSSPFQDIKDIGTATLKSISTRDAGCGAAVAATIGEPAVSFLATISIVFPIANDAFKNVRVCGSNWMKPNPSTYKIDAEDYKARLKIRINEKISNNSNLNLGDKDYREFLYNGVEFEDNPNEGQLCRDPTILAGSGKTLTSEEAATAQWEKYAPQRYYFRGLQSNYNCEKYFIEGKNDPITQAPPTPQRLEDFRYAYQCCKIRQRNYICLSKDGGSHKMCKNGSTCSVSGITYKARSFKGASKTDDRLICAESESACPFNFTISGGTGYCDSFRDGMPDGNGGWTMIDQNDVKSGECSSKSEIRNADCTYNDKAGKCRNYCQYLTHCTVAQSGGNRYVSGLGSPYFSSACIDFVGDSRNETSYNGGIIFGRQQHFSAPIAQCIKESLENIFQNRAGHSQCKDAKEIPTSNGTCPSGNYIEDGSFVYKKGNQVKNKSFFAKIQDHMRLAVKMTLVFSVMFYGMKILLGVAEIPKKELLPYILKISLVLYFATGDAWQSKFFDGVYGASSTISDIVFKISTPKEIMKRDGCQFGNVNLPDGTPISSGITYPAGKSYLALWDTLDCKIARYLAIGPNFSAGHIASLIFAGFFTGPYGLYFAISLMFFGFFFLAATIRALHIFISSCIALILMVFVSPLVIPLVLFERTKAIFEGWLGKIISYIFQPMILFAYIAVFVNILDKTVIGSATFHGSPPDKVVSCKSTCYKANGQIVDDPQGTYLCDAADEVKIDPKNNSVLCMIQDNIFANAPGFQFLGLPITILKNLTTGDVKSKVLTLLRAAMVMFLLYQFMDQIPSITSQLVGGGLPTASGNLGTGPLEMLKAASGMARSVQSRTNNAMKKWGRKTASGTKEAAKELANAIGSQGRESVATKDSSTNMVGSDSGNSTNAVGSDANRSDHKATGESPKDSKVDSS